jgi:hemolysin activation/secretion protein
MGKRTYKTALQALGLLLCATASHAALAQEAADPEEGWGPVFSIDAIDVIGNTVLPREVIERAVYPQLGPQKTLLNIQAAQAVLERAYRERGYETVSVEIPGDTAPDGSFRLRIIGGVVTLRVIETPIGRVRVVGAEYTLPSDVKAQTPAFAEGRSARCADAIGRLE